MLGAECGAARGDRRVDAGQMHGHHIGIAFDDHRLAFLHNRRFGKVDAVQHLCFAVQLRVGRVDVFRIDRVILVQLARAEAKRTTGRITNRPCHAATEIVVYATLALTGESRVEHLLLGEAFAGKVPHQVIPSLGGISAAEPLAVGLAEVATVQQLARGERLLGHQLGDEEFLRRLVGFEQACAFRTGVRGHVVGFVVMQFDMVFVGEQLHRVTKVDVLLMFDVAEHVAAETAAEAMPYAKRRAHGKTWRFLVMEGAQAYVCTGSRGFERDGRGYDVIQVGGGADLFYVFLLDHSRHTVQPTSPFSREGSGGSGRTCRSGSPPGLWPRAGVRRRCRPRANRRGTRSPTRWTVWDCPP